MSASAMLEFKGLVQSIVHVHQELGAQASRAVNLSLTLRNWMIGYYIDAFELRGADRADYGDQLFANLSRELTVAGLSNCDKRQLYRYLRLFRTYPQMVGTLSPQWQNLLPAGFSPEPPPRIVETVSPQLAADTLLARFSYSHLELLVDLEDDLKRHFFEMECLRGNWSVRELRRQIGSLYYERIGLSHDKTKLSDQVQSRAEHGPTALNVRDPYVFEFLGIKSQEVMHESDLENAILGNLQDFLLELGHGFCFEARQKRLLIGSEHFFVDLVFYHRILKCHVLIELKTGHFSHENIGQLNTYVSWYKKTWRWKGTTPLSASCFARKRTSLWSSTRWPAWTTSCSCPNTSWNCRGARTWSASWPTSSAKRVSRNKEMPMHHCPLDKAPKQARATVPTFTLRSAA